MTGQGIVLTSLPPLDTAGQSVDVTDNYPVHNRPIVGQSLVSILGSQEIPFPGLRKKIETLESR